MEANDVTPDSFNEQAHQPDAIGAKQPFLTYIRPLREEEGRGYAVCSEYGTVLASFPNFDAAYYTSRQFHLAPQALN